MRYSAKYLIWINPDSSVRPLVSPVKVRETFGGGLLTEADLCFRDMEGPFSSILLSSNFQLLKEIRLRVLITIGGSSFFFFFFLMKQHSFT